MVDMNLKGGWRFMHLRVEKKANAVRRASVNNPFFLFLRVFDAVHHVEYPARSKIMPAKDSCL